MNLYELQKINEIRAKRWHNDGKTNWTLLEWAGAMCGEAGEAANVAKKMRRLQQELPNREAGLSVHDYPQLQMALARELADTIIYALIIFSEIEVNADVVIAEVFDKKSIEYGFPERAPR